MSSEAENLAKSLEELAKKVREDPSLVIKTSRFQRMTVTGEPTLFTGIIKVQVELFDPALKNS